MWCEREGGGRGRFRSGEGVHVVMVVVQHALWELLVLYWMI